uniref:Uncharacterized protein n=1 Tax=Arundo donax TaxID=35708 RepID=A0A0A9CTA9_ARUDO
MRVPFILQAQSFQRSTMYQLLQLLRIRFCSVQSLDPSIRGTISVSGDLYLGLVKAGNSQVELPQDDSRLAPLPH